MKKMMTILITLLTMICLVSFSMAEGYEVPVEITIVTEDSGSILSAPQIPSGTFSAEVFGFDAGQTYAVYSAPDVKSIRGAKGKSKVSTNDWVQVFGRDGDWLMVQYDVSGKFYRIGYISAKAIPVGMTVPDLILTSDTAVTMEAVNVTDDPLGAQGTLVELPADSRVKQLGIMGDWSYIESTKDDKLFRGFVPSSVLSDSLFVFSVEEASRILEGEWNVYAGDAGNADHLTFHSDGSIFGKLSSDTSAWDGQWAITQYNTARATYWNEPEFELTIRRDEGIFNYGLRICWEPYGTNGATHALILSESERSSGLVLCK